MTGRDDSNRSAELAAALGFPEGEGWVRDQVSAELLAILDEYGPLPSLPRPDGATFDFAVAVNEHIRRDSAPFDVARREAIRRYFGQTALRSNAQG